MFYYTPPPFLFLGKGCNNQKVNTARERVIQRLLMVDGIRRNKKRRHSVATKQGIKKAKAHKIVVKKAKILLRKSKKHDIVQNLFKAKPVG